MDQSVKALFGLYLQRSDLRPASVDIKTRACEYFCQWFGHRVGGTNEKPVYDLPVKDVTDQMALDYRTMLGRGRTAVSVNGYLNNFRAFWSWLHRHSYITTDPFVFVGPLKIDEQPPRDTFTAVELGRIMAVAEPIEQIQVCLGLLGCRRGEMQTIQVRDVHLKDIEPHIVLRKKDDGKTTLAWGTKSHRMRYVPLPAAMAFDGRIVGLRKLVEDRIAELGGCPDAYVCVHGKYIQQRLKGKRDWNALRDLQGNHPRKFRQLQKRAGIYDVRRFHELRAAFTTAMLDAGIDSSRVAALVGHANVAQTMKYDRKQKLSLVAQAAEIASHTYISNVS